MRLARGPYAGFKLERRAPSAALLFVLCATKNDRRSEWRPAWAIHRDGTDWVIRQWSWFDNAWFWRHVERPERISLYSRSGRHVVATHRTGR